MGCRTIGPEPDGTYIIFELTRTYKKNVMVAIIMEQPSPFELDPSYGEARPMFINRANIRTYRA